MKQAAFWTAVVALFAVPFLPLYVESQLYFPFITGKGFAFRILVEIALGAWVLLALMDKEYRPRFSWLLALFGGLVAWMAIANTFGVNPLKAFWSNYERMDGWIMLIHVFAFFVVAGSILVKNKLWDKWWLTFVGASALTTIIALFQLAGLGEIHQGGVRVDASFGNAAYLAAYLLFTIAISLWQASKRQGWMRYALIALAVVQVFIVFETETRGAILGLVGGALVAMTLVALGSGKRVRRIALGGLFGLILIIGGFIAVKDTEFIRNEPALARIASISVKELGTRLTVWNMARQGVMDDPITGWGQEGFNQVFNTYYEPSMYRQEAWFDRAHNTYLDWLVAGGIPAFLLFVSLLLYLLWSLYHRSETPLERALLIGVLSAYGIQALVVFDNLFTYVPLAAILAYVHGRTSRPIEKLQALPELKEQQLAIAGPVVFVATAVLIWVVNVPGIRAAHHLIYAISSLPQGHSENLKYFELAIADNSFATQEIREQFGFFSMKVSSSPEATDEFKTLVTTRAVEELQKEVDRVPTDARLRLQLASAYESAGDLQGALTELNEAMRLTPKKQNIMVHTGLLLVENGFPEQGRELLHKAYELDTSFEELGIVAAAGDILGGEMAIGKALLQEAVGTTTPDNDTIFYAYYQAKQYPELIAVAKAKVASSEGSADARYRLAQAYAAARQFELARREILATIVAHPETRTKGEALMSQIFTPAQ
ncbi:O-antigen ligase family protein [Patescibacteria group bacterium]|nr:O-antigen ligase family protein [Patescibacteria group bacterium]MBU1501116.1 O-antigen ligase family protein [Patescibacteria group bacterium]MBU2081011.1 O-antigen ligase family protein [Patescibacteria group bacterium]MBU2124103.1 O-antigen ligase family protein [Patescibacteria group bacterium]MBU2194958.1 O-antigen ligase family protein [Patescibacteria group bacterium]